MIPAGDLRLAARSLAFVASTGAHLTGLGLDLQWHASNEQHRIVHKWRRSWAGGLMKLYGLDVKACGDFAALGEQYPGTSENGRGRVFILNHRSGMDIILSLVFFEAYMVSRADLAAWPLIGLAARSTGTLFVDRSSSKSGRAVVDAMAGALRQGHGVALYPEGTTFSGDEVRALKSGAFRAAQEAEAEIVPVGLAYASSKASFGDETFGQHMRRVAGMGRIEVALEVGEPYRCQDKSMKVLRQEGRQRLQELVNQARQRVGSN